MERGWTRAIALMLNGQTLQMMDEEGRWIIDDSFFILVNAASEGVEFTIPVSPSGNPWSQIIDTENIEIRLSTKRWTPRSFWAAAAQVTK